VRTANVKSTDRDGYTIYLVLVIISIFSILFYVTLININSLTYSSVLNKQKIQAGFLAQSGIVRAEYFLNGNESHNMNWETPLFEEEVNDYGLIQLSVSGFGAYSRIKSIGKRLHAVKTINGIFGRNVPGNMMPVLTITGHIGGLSLNKGSGIKGNVVLNHGQIYVENKSVLLSEMGISLLARESPALPFDSLYINGIFDSLSSADSLVSLSARSKYSVGQEINPSNDSLFKSDTMAISGDCTINGAKLVNKIITVTGTIKISGASDLSRSRISASKIILENCITEHCLFYGRRRIAIGGGLHNSQFFSRDSISIASGTGFGRMNLVANYRDTSGKDSCAGGIYMESGAKIKGTIISVLSPQARKKKPGPSIFAKNNIEINGCMITDNDIDMSDADICGHIWCKAVVTSKDNINYTNTLFNTRINPSDCPLPFPLCGELPVRIVFDGEKY
jgi:hypothetical protein